MKSSVKLAAGLVVFLSAAILAAPCAAFDEVFQQTYPLPAGGSFQLRNLNGSVRINGWEKNEVEIHAVKFSRHRSEDLARVQIEVDAQPDSVAVLTRYPRDEGVDVYVEYRIRVPRHVLLPHVSTVNGTISVSGVESQGALSSVNGNIEVFDTAGGLSARTTNGSLRMEFRRLEPTSPMALETVNGSVALSLPSDAGAELDARSVNGDFRSELPITFESSLGSREFRGKIGGGGGKVRLRTVNGGIRVVSVRPTV